MIYLSAEGIVKQYDNHRALDGVSIAVPQNSIYGLLGPNGAGKTTLIRIINQITAPDSGRIMLAGNLISSKDIAKIGYLPEERGLYKKMKVKDQIIFLAQIKGMSRHDAILAMRYWLQKFEIERWENKKIEELSKGMQQKVQFITTVMHHPQLLIFDEPFSGFDPINANLLKSEILELNAAGATIIFSTHNMASVEEICQEITLINRSKVVLQGSVNQIRHTYRKGIFKVHLQTEMPISSTSTYSILSQEQMADSRCITLRKEQGINNNKLFAQLATAGEILHFEEVLPSMNDVFIESVSGNNMDLNNKTI